ncbi:MAG: hypothetical protein A2W05_09790 [Candidatus Schekmanbacteria bacterium RBG_16_38_10]|uniref:Uncharacterized protein n=1 Tax=Candidatus Schekmanbacteria bacterium RBG_16_38_10 TaxID=1817879 RepID=A0A1F7S251_9BACT|nr:MAG: hypothetical protein A2W05_09790 [Candidatus Schekmanbacteria bacterium RBG_16_38_10]
MTIIDAWHKLFSLSSGNRWIKIPEEIRRVLSLPSTIGIAGGILCTQRAAIGSNQFINKLNSIGDK